MSSCRSWKSTLVVLVLGILTISVHGEVYTALAEMEELLETESVLISNLEGYIRVQEDKLSYLKTQQPGPWSESGSGSGSESISFRSLDVCFVTIGTRREILAAQQLTAALSLSQRLSTSTSSSSLLSLSSFSSWLPHVARAAAASN
ncbi:hypothetical protein ACLKA7_010844 [Drosophila subpalustris]